MDTSSPMMTSAELFMLRIKARAVAKLIPGVQFYYSGHDLVMPDGSDPPSEEAIKAAVQQELDSDAMVELRKKRDEELAKTDWHIVKAMESGVAVDPAILEYRQKLRDLPTSLTQAPELDSKGNFVVNSDFPQL
jgi:Phage tail assembly chaperone protein